MYEVKEKNEPIRERRKGKDSKMTIEEVRQKRLFARMNRTCESSYVAQPNARKQQVYLEDVRKRRGGKKSNSTNRKAKERGERENYASMSI